MTAAYTFDVFSSLDGFDGFGGVSGGNWGGYWGKQGPELLDHRPIRREAANGLRRQHIPGIHPNAGREH